MQINLEGFEKKEIGNVSGKSVLFKRISIPDENCMHFMIRYEIIDLSDQSSYSSLIHCLLSAYQRDVSQVLLNKSVFVPDNCSLSIRIESKLNPDFNGDVLIDYEIFIEKQKKVFITNEDRNNAFRIALINLARFFKIPNWEYENNQTLYNKIKTINNPIVKPLQNYFNAYDNWFKFLVEKKKIEEKTGKGYELSDKEQSELYKLMSIRQKSLEDLQTKFDELQFERFQNEHGLGNVDGIIL